MVRYIAIILIEISSFALFIGCGDPNIINDTSTPAVAIYGHIIADSSHSLAGAQINIVDMRERLISQPTSDENGDFTAVVAPGMYIIVPQPVFGTVNYIHPERDTVQIYLEHSLYDTIYYRSERKQ